jgi:uncharacterized membrane protein YphA (DoxX/SURF4 family)
MNSSAKTHLHKPTLQTFAVWLCRIIVGATFLVSGWAKAIDPWGFLYKAQEYLTEWGMLGIPREILITGCIALACIEFTTGLLVAVGALRRFSVMTAAGLMAFMLPLTIYIYIYSPVSDCGCFGDFIILSNGATLIKNIILTPIIVYLLIANKRVAGLYDPAIQWLVITAAYAFSIFIAYVGYDVQPIKDFRPYPVGSSLISESDEDSNSAMTFIYEKDGEQKEFAFDALPDSTWTYVDRVESTSDTASERLAIYDYDDDVTEEVIDTTNPQLLLLVTDPGIAYLSRARLANEMNDYIVSKGGSMLALVGASGERLENWRQLASPHCDVYSVESTTLKQLARGDAALVYMTDGVIRWKRTLSSMNAELFEDTEINDDVNIFDTIEPIDDGRFHTFLCLILVAVLAILFVINFTPKALRFVTINTKKPAVETGDKTEATSDSTAESNGIMQNE